MSQLIRSDIQAFFHSYAKAFVSLDANALVDLYTMPLLLVHQDEPHFFSTIEQLSENMVGLVEAYRTIGLNRAEFEVLSCTTLSGKVTQVHVQWSLYKGDQDRFSYFDCFYHLLEDKNGVLKVLTCVNASEEIEK